MDAYVDSRELVSGFAETDLDKIKQKTSTILLKTLIIPLFRVSKYKKQKTI